MRNRLLVNLIKIDNENIKEKLLELNDEGTTTMCLILNNLKCPSRYLEMLLNVEPVGEPSVCRNYMWKDFLSSWKSNIPPRYLETQLMLYKNMKRTNRGTYSVFLYSEFIKYLIERQDLSDSEKDTIESKFLALPLNKHREGFMNIIRCGLTCEHFNTFMTMDNDSKWAWVFFSDRVDKKYVEKGLSLKEKEINLYRIYIQIIKGFKDISNENRENILDLIYNHLLNDTTHQNYIFCDLLVNCAVNIDSRDIDINEKNKFVEFILNNATKEKLDILFEALKNLKDLKMEYLELCSKTSSQSTNRMISNLLNAGIDDLEKLQILVKYSLMSNCNENINAFRIQDLILNDVDEETILKYMEIQLLEESEIPSRLENNNN